MLPEELIRNRIAQVNDALDANAKERAILEEAQRSDLRLLEMCRETPPLPLLHPAGGGDLSTIRWLSTPVRRVKASPKKGETAVNLIGEGAPNPVTITAIVEALKERGFEMASDREAAERNTIWLLRNEVRSKNAPIRDLGRGRHWLWLSRATPPRQEMTETQAAT